MRAGYGESMRNYFVKKTNPLLLIDFAGVKVFDEATVDVNILTYQKDKNRQQTQACVVKKEGTENLSVYLRHNSAKCNFKSDSSWTILSPIEQSIKSKIESIGIPLKDWKDIQINYGVKTGYNEAFIIDGMKRKELIEQDPKSDEIIRPILRGRDIKRYGYEFADLWLINTHNGVKEKNINPINVEDYPSIKKHLDKFYSALDKRQDKGYTPYNLRNCAYIDDFYKQKIVYPNMTKFLPFVYDNNGFVTNQKCFIITGKHIPFLTAFLNSSAFKFCFKDNFPELLGGTRELSKIFFDKIPVIEIHDNLNISFEKKVIEIQKLKQQNIDTKKQEIEIDNMIFDLYQLTAEERESIGFIEIQ